MPVRRFRNIKIRYTRDNGRDKVVVQRTYVNVDDGTAQTPITPLLLAREITEPWVLEPREGRDRHIESCFVVNNKESVFRSIIPYHPNDPNIKNHAREIRDYPGIVSATYKGENRKHR